MRAKDFVYCPRCATALETRELDGHDRRVCPDTDCGFVFYGNPTPVVAAIVERGDDVVLVRNVGWPETWFGLVSGFLERKEDPAQGALREVEEELGVHAELVSMVGVYPFDQMNQVILAYHVRVSGGAEITIDPKEIDAFKLVPVDRLKPWPFGTGAAVADWIAARS
jgi:NADH pyrophosphatase NudC (nudix superfamily)